MSVSCVQRTLRCELQSARCLSILGDFRRSCWWLVVECCIVISADFKFAPDLSPEIKGTHARALTTDQQISRSGSISCASKKRGSLCIYNIYRLPPIFVFCFLYFVFVISAIFASPLTVSTTDYTLHTLTLTAAAHCCQPLLLHTAAAAAAATTATTAATAATAATATAVAAKIVTTDDDNDNDNDADAEAGESTKSTTPALAKRSSLSPPGPPPPPPA